MKKILKSTCNVCGDSNPNFFLFEWRKEKIFFKKGKCKSNHSSAMWSFARCVIIDDKVLRLHDCWTNSKFLFRGFQSNWNKFLKPAVKVAAPFIAMVVSAKTKNLKFGQATTKIQRSRSGGENLSLNYMHSKSGFRLKVM